MEVICFVFLVNVGNFLGIVIVYFFYNGLYLIEMGYYGRY